MPRSSLASSSRRSRSSADGSSSTTMATLSRRAANRSGSSPSACSTSCSNSRREMRITSPAGDDVEAKDPLAVRPLERTGVIDLDGDVAQQDARADAGADHGNALRRVAALEFELHAFVAGGADVVLPLAAPRRRGVDKRFELGRNEAG